MVLPTNNASTIKSKIYGTCIWTDGGLQSLKSDGGIRSSDLNL